VYIRRAFPLRLGYAITSHASQGATIATHLIVYVRNAFQAGMLYVIASRVTERRLMRFALGIPPLADWAPIQLPF
jgi:hypothetical protein